MTAKTILARALGLFGMLIVMQLEFAGIVHTAPSYAVLRSFGDCPGFTDGVVPYRASLVADAEGYVYGTTLEGGEHDWGVVFKMKNDGSECEILHSFALTDGGSPVATLILDGTTLYGTTLQGGLSGKGTVFKIATDGTGFEPLHSFNGDDGEAPYSPLVLDAAGNLYGTTYAGGSSNHGTVYTIRTVTGFDVLHSFSWTDGSIPMGALALDEGQLYGTTQAGGAFGIGTVFKQPIAGGSLEVLKDFDGDGGLSGSPSGGVVMDHTGTLFGTTLFGGPLGRGTVFKINKDKTGYTVLYDFSDPSDGKEPVGVILDGAGTLFGTTLSGGASDLGTVFTLQTGGAGHDVLHDFAGGVDDGSHPRASLALDAAGNLYGTTDDGGGANAGTVFKLGGVAVGPRYHLSIVLAGTGNGTVGINPGGIICGPTCEAWFVPETSVTLTPSAAAGSTFAGWSGKCSGDGETTVTMDAHKSCTATFDLVTSGADLTGSWTSLAQVCGTGRNALCRLVGVIDYENIGTTRAASGAVVSFYLSSDTALDSDDILMRESNLGGFDPGEIKTKSYRFAGGENVSGRYLLAVIDSTGVITESNEANNLVISAQIP